MTTRRERGRRGLAGQVARGILADGSLRRRVMGGIVLAAAFLLMAGATFGARWLQDRPVLFILFWLAVAWLTVTALLMALFDLLLVRKAGRAARHRLRKELLEREDGPHPPDTGPRP